MMGHLFTNLSHALIYTGSWYKDVTTSTTSRAQYVKISFGKMKTMKTKPAIIR